MHSQPECLIHRDIKVQPSSPRSVHKNVRNALLALIPVSAHSCWAACPVQPCCTASAQPRQCQGLMAASTISDLCCLGPSAPPTVLYLACRAQSTPCSPDVSAVAVYQLTMLGSYWTRTCYVALTFWPSGPAWYLQASGCMAVAGLYSSMPAQPQNVLLRRQHTGVPRPQEAGRSSRHASAAEASCSYHVSPGLRLQAQPAEYHRLLEQATTPELHVMRAAQLLSAPHLHP